ncbi:MAG: nickel pincer cofactor biosynthesis protein LarC [Thermodesulfobacteriota bacterium]
MRILYIDAFSGASGDMFLGALLDMGVPLESLETEVRKLPLERFRLVAVKEPRHGIYGTRLTVELHERIHAHRTMAQIRTVLQDTGLEPQVRDLALRVFERLAEAEGRVHGVAPEAVTFHEVGALDSVVDIVGAAAGIRWLSPDRVVSSALPLGRGFVRGGHGVLPVPAPATLEILKGVPVSEGGQEGELVTPTGAAIIREIAHDFGPLPAMRMEMLGYGVGHRDLSDRPNLLRLILGEADHVIFREDWVLEANIDDMNPEFCEHLMETLMAQGALDVSWSPLIMKRGRPGVLLRVLAEPHLRDSMAEIILRESTSIGVRFLPMLRRCLERRHEVVETPWGPVRIKVSYAGGEVLNALPEYQDCREIASRAGVPVKEVYHEALSIYRRNRTRP